MKILYIHTYYIQRGGEDGVYEDELRLMEEAGWETESLLFSNRKYAALKFLVFFFNPVSFWKTCRAIRRFKPDVVHVHNWFFAASPAVFIAARWMRVPVVHTIHNFRILCPSSFLFVKNELFLDCMSRVFPLEAIRRRIYRDSAFNTGWLLTGTRLHYLLGTWQRIDRLICLTGPARQMLVDSLLHIEPERISVKPNFFAGFGPDAPDSEADAPDPDADAASPDAPGKAGHRKDFLFVGRLSPEKGISLLLDAFRNSPFTLKIIGDGPLRGEVESCAADYPNIHYLGHQDKQQIIRYLHHCQALIFTTIGFEQFGLVIVEAFACGTPVIGPDTGSPAELIIEGFNGLHFRTGSVPDLRQKIQYFHQLPDITRQSFSRNARENYYKHYTPQTNLRLLSNIYKSVLHENNADL